MTTLLKDGKSSVTMCPAMSIDIEVKSYTGLIINSESYRKAETPSAVVDLE